MGNIIHAVMYNDDNFSICGSQDLHAVIVMLEEGEEEVEIIAQAYTMIGCGNCKVSVKTIFNHIL